MKINKIPFLQQYNAFHSLILDNKKNFFKLSLVLILEIFILALSVILTIPIVEFLMGVEFSQMSKVTKVVLKFLKYCGIEPNLSWMIGLFVLFNILKSLATTLVTYYILNMKYYITYNLSSILMDRSMNAKINFYDHRDSGYFINTYTSIIDKISTAFSDLALQLAMLVKLIAYLIIPFFFNIKITLLTIFLTIILILPFKFVNKLAYDWGKKNNDFENKKLKNLSEIFQSIRVIFTYNLKDYFKKLFLYNLGNSIKFAKRNLITQTIIVNFFYPIGLLSASIAFIIFFQNKENISEFAAIFWSLISAVPVFSSLLKGNFNIQNLTPSYEQYKNIISDSEKGNMNVNQGHLKVTNLNNSIKFKDISFCYEDNKYFLKNKNFEIKKNKIILISGASGSGKSTIIDLILGLREPVNGSIFIDEKPYGSINLKYLREMIGYVSQEPFFYEGSIFENFRMIKENITEKEIYDLIDLCDCSEFVNNKQEKIHYNVGERGSNLSGGQRQRLSIARCLIKNPQILLLDEPTSSLDHDSIKSINKTLNKLKSKFTIVLVTHNVDHLPDVDTTVKL